jgi:hypothetical protein
MVHERDKAIELLFDFRCSRQIRRHIFVFGLGAGQTAVESVDEHDTGRNDEMSLNVGDEDINLLFQVQGRRDQMEEGTVDTVMLLEGLDPRRQTLAPLKADIHHADLFDPPSTVVET